MIKTTRPHVLITYPISERKRALLETTLGNVQLIFLADSPPASRSQLLSEADVLLSWNVFRELGADGLPLLKRLRMVQLLSAGADHVPFSALSPNVIIASNIGAFAEPMAEHVVAMVFALAKNLLKQHRKLEAGDFDQKTLNRMLRGRICGILGFGGIGKAVANLMRPLGLEMYALNTSGKTGEDVTFVGTLRDLRHVLSSSDVIVVSLPLNKQTRNLIGKQELDWMKPDAILINVARGEIIDEDALFDHLVRHPDFLAGIDAWWVEPFRHGEFRMKHPFLSLPNVLGSPHNSSMVPSITTDATRRAAENIKRFLNGEPVTGIVRREDYV